MNLTNYDLRSSLFALATEAAMPAVDCSKQEEEGLAIHREKAGQIAVSYIEELNREALDPPVIEPFHVKLRSVPGTLQLSGKAFDEEKWAVLKGGFFAYGKHEETRARLEGIASRTSLIDLKGLADHFNQEVIDWSICEEEEIGERLLLALAFELISEETVGTIFNYISAVKDNLGGDRSRLNELPLFLENGEINPEALKLMEASAFGETAFLLQRSNRSLAARSGKYRELSICY